MGIGTLIIFIATILVAAVAAGVLISTSGILQQRALITGQEARKKITNSIEVISVIGHGNRTDESLNNIEVLVRLDAGSDPIQMKKFDISWIGSNYDASADLQHWTLNNPRIDEDGFDEAVGTIDNNTWTYIRDLDDDNIMERVMLLTMNDSDDVLVFNFSSSDAGYYYADLRVNLSNASVSPVQLNLMNQPIVGQDNLYYGFFYLNGTISEIDSISNINTTFNISANPFVCNFFTVSPEEKYCYEVMHGDDDLVLGDGEVFKLYFRLRPEHRMFISEEFRFIFSTEKGRLSQATARTPDVITTLKVPLWPVG